MEIVKKVWVIMDKKRKVIASGVPRNRELKLINDNTGTTRILTYASEKKAISGYRDSGFFDWGEAGKYMDLIYGDRWQGVENYKNIADYPLEAVEVELILKFK